MEKKRSVGIIVFSILAIVAGLLLCRSAIINLVIVTSIHYDPSPAPYTEKVIEQIQATIQLVFGLSCIISGIFLVLLKKWAKNLFLFLMLVWLFAGPWFTRYYFLRIESKAIDFVWLFWAFLFFVFPSLIAFCYFTRPKVKRQFMNQEGAES